MFMKSIKKETKWADKSTRSYDMLDFKVLWKRHVNMW